MDASTARRLPDEFLGSTGTSIDRTLSLVFRHWRSYPLGEQRQLAQALLSLLEPLLAQPSGEIPDALRDDCARTIRLWEERKGLALVPDTAAPVDPNSPTRPPRVVRFLRADLDRLPYDRCRVRVELQRGAGERFEGSAESLYMGNESLRCAAEATAQAILLAVAASGDALTIEKAKLDDIFGNQVVFVEVTANYRGDRRQLLGFCRVENDLIRAAAFAVLNATNRFLDLT